MPAKDLTETQIESMVGERHPIVGIEVPPRGLQPYYAWLIRAIQRLADTSCGPLRVAPDSESATAVAIAPGRATIGAAGVVYDGGSLELATFNNTTALVYLQSEGQIAAKDISSGEPAEAHLKLAEVTLAAGRITTVLDRRFESVFKA